MDGNYWKVSTVIIVVTFFSPAFLTDKVHARARVPVPIPLSAGRTIYEIGPAPDLFRLLSPELNHYKLGYKCYYTFGRHKLSFLKPAKNVGIDIIS